MDVHDRLVAGNQRCLGRSVAGTGTATRSRAARPSSGSAPRGIHPTIVARVARRRSRLRARRVDGLQVHDPAPRTAVTALSNDLGPSSPHKSCQDCIIATCGHDFRDGQGAKLRPQTAPGMPRRLLPLVKVRLFTKPPYVAGPHPWADKFVPRHLSDGFGQFPFVHGDPLANQFDGSFLIGFICKKIPHNSRVSLGIESRDPDVPSCWHSHAPQLSSVNDLPYTN